MHEYYFAYGMLTDPDIMPEDAEFIGRATLFNHRLDLYTYADAAYDRNETMDGVLWSVSPQLLSRLDIMEGYPTLYDRKRVQLQYEGETVTAWIYFMTEHTKKRMAGKKPSRYYINSMLRGYKHADISTRGIQSALNR
jgi:gamma-glutamylcyclotransferase (GGCT)/AIG2-like uncharacterized protein YtfP